MAPDPFVNTPAKSPGYVEIRGANQGANTGGNDYWRFSPELNNESGNSDRKNLFQNNHTTPYDFRNDVAFGDYYSRIQTVEFDTPEETARLQFDGNDFNKNGCCHVIGVVFK